MQGANRIMAFVLSNRDAIAMTMMIGSVITRLTAYRHSSDPYSIVCSYKDVGIIYENALQLASY